MSTEDINWAAGFFIFLGLSLIFNCLFWVVFCRRRRLKSKSYFIFLFALSLVDTLAAGTWTSLSAVASLIGWEFQPEVCRLQSFMLTFAQSLTAFLLATVALERLLRMVKPSRHRVVFTPKVTVFAIAGLVVFCGVVSSIHLYGYVTTSWHSTEHQCGADFTESVRFLDMTFCFDHAIPFYVIALPAFIATFFKVFWAGRHPSKYGEIVLERNTYAPSDSYSSRLAKLQSKFVASNKKSKGKTFKPTLGHRIYSSKGYTEADHWDSDIDDGKDDKREKDSRERNHNLPRPEYSMLVMAAIVTLVTVLLWFPWIVARFIWNKTPRESLPDGFAAIAIICMHSAAFVKPILYFLTNPFFRSAVSKTFCGRKKSRELLVIPEPTTQEEHDNLGHSGIVESSQHQQR